MPLLPDPPYDRILLAMQADAEGVDYAELAGVLDPVTHRQSRKRGPVRSERPALTFIFVGDESVPGENGLTEWEIAREMTADLQADIELETVLSGEDPTGLRVPGRMLAAAIQAMRAEGSATRRLVDWIEEGDVEPEDRSQAEDGRLTRSLKLKYRVSAVDGNVLLAEGVNA